MDNSQEKTLTQLLATIKTLLLDNALDEALVSIKTVIEQFPQEAEGYFLYAEIYLKKGLNNKAVEYLYKAALLDPNNINYQGRLAEALFLMDKLDAAIEYYQHSLQLDPNAAWAYIGLGNIAEKQVIIDKAIDYFQQALNLNSGNLELRARLLRLKNTYQDNYLQSPFITQISTPLNATTINSNQIEQDNDDYGDNDDFYTSKQIKIESKDLQQKQLNTANQVYRNGHKEKALSLYLNYLKQYPLNWFVHQRVGDIYLNLKHYDEAIIHYDEVLSINANYEWALHNISLTYYLLADWDKSLDYYHQLCLQSPLFWNEQNQDYNVQKHLGFMLLHSRQEKQARQVFESAILEQENPWDYYLKLAISTKKTQLQANNIPPLNNNPLADNASLDEVLNLKTSLRDFLFPPHSKQWRYLIAKSPASTAPCANAKGFLESISVCSLTQRTIVIGWAISTDNSILWLEDETGNTYPLDKAYYSFRQDIYDLYAADFGSAANKASFILLIDAIKAGSSVKLKTASATGIHLLYEIESKELARNPVAAARYLFSAAIPIAQFHQRVPLIEQVILEPLIEHNAQLQKNLPVQITQCGAALAKPLVSVIVPLYGRVDFVEHQLMEFARDSWFLENDELIYVIDDPKLVAEFTSLAQDLYALYRVPFRWLWGSSNRGFSGANNLGVSDAKGDYFCFLNSDAFAQQAGWLEKLVAVLQTNPTIGAVGPRLVFADGSIQHAGMAFLYRPELGVWVNHHPHLGLHPSLDPNKELSLMPAITGACLVMRRRDFERVDGWDTGYLIGDFEDSDLCLKIRELGLNIAYLPSVQLTHLERQSFKIQGEGDFRTRLVLYNAVRHQTRWAAQLASATDLD